MPCYRSLRHRSSPVAGSSLETTLPARSQPSRAVTALPARSQLLGVHVHAHPICWAANGAQQIAQRLVVRSP